jgi:hypothetical protein
LFCINTEIQQISSVSTALVRVLERANNEAHSLLSRTVIHFGIFKYVANYLLSHQFLKKKILGEDVVQEVCCYFMEVTWLSVNKGVPSRTSYVTQVTERKAPYTISFKTSEFTVWRHTRWKNWVNCEVLTDNNAGLRTVVSIRISHSELRSSLRKSHSFPSLPADTTMESSQGTPPSKINKREATLVFIESYRSLALRFLFYFSDNIMADVASKQQTTALFLSTTVTHTQ